MKNKLTKTVSVLSLLAVLLGVGTYTFDKDSTPNFVKEGEERH